MKANELFSFIESRCVPEFYGITLASLMIVVYSRVVKIYINEITFNSLRS